MAFLQHLLSRVDPALSLPLPVVGLVLLVAYAGALVVYRLWFSPIAQFPGPKLAAVTFWYEFYYDVILGGQYTFHVMDLHKKYGPVVRINPRELHFYTPQFYEEIYAGPTRRRDRWGYYTKGFGMPGAGASTNPHDLHKARRAALSPYFSMQSVRKLQAVIEEKADMLMRRFKRFGESAPEDRKPVDLPIAFAAYAYDVVVEYAFARSDHHLEAEDFEPWMHHAAIGTSSLGQIAKNMYWVFWLILHIPDWLAKRLDPNASRYLQFKRDINTQIENIRSGYNTAHKTASHPTIFHEILYSSLPEAEKRTSRLADEGATVVSAGTVTTAWTLPVTVFYLLSDPVRLRKLKTELYEAIPDPTKSTPLPELERLPYLTGVIQEGLRLSYGICTRLERIAPDETLVFHDGNKAWKIPPGTPMSMTSMMIHQNPDIFSSPSEYRPERWIENPRLDKYLVAFSKGKMQCLGINLAYAELYLMLAKLFRVYGSKEVRFDGDVGRLELYETTLRDVQVAEDRFIPLPPRDSKGVRVTVECF
ncbi:Cytochrome P450 monooxygenase tpcC [Exophiala dermatitidis]